MSAHATFPAWVFDNSPIDDPFGYGERAVNFLRHLRHPKSTARGRAFTLDPWQERIVRRIYGPRHPDGTRIVRQVFLLLPRGNRKTSLAAALALLHVIGPEKIPGGEVLSAASDRKQARLGYTEALGIIRADKRLDRLVLPQDYRNKLTFTRTGSFYEAISAEAGTQHGRTPAFVLADELHAWPKRDLWDVLESGLIKVPGSLLIVASTSGRGQNNVAYQKYTYAKKVAAGDIDDPTVLPVIFEAPRDCDWRDEALWREVNPGLSCNPPYPDIVGLRANARKAEHQPGDREAFLQLNLNVWLDHSTSPFVDMDVYDRGAADIDHDALTDKPCWLAVDLSSTTDLSAIVACWKADDGYIVRPWFFCPADNLRARSQRDGVPYTMWAADGHITPTPGNVIDYRYIEDQVRDLCATFDVQEVAFDPWGARAIIQNLLADGLPAVEMRQGWVTMGPAIKELERAIIAGKLQHGGHPVLRWNFSNIAVETDKAGNKTFHKGKSTDRIDGAQATAMAVGRASLGGSNRSIYSNVSDRPSGLLFI